MTADQLLADTAWLKRLAVSLAGNADDADDLVQESRIAAWQRAPDRSRSLRPWLTKVVRDLAGMRRRSTARRLVREQAAIDDSEPARPDALLAQMRLHKLLVEMVLELDEPYRSTIIARFVEGRSAVAIARAAGIPESTVRGRLRDGLIALRALLDARTGDRTAWAPAVLAFAPRGTSWVPGIIAVAAAAGILLVMVSRSALTAAPAGGARANAAAVRRGDVAPSATTASAHATPIASASRPWWDVPGVVLRPLAGTVITADGAPIAGAIIQLYGWGAQVTGVPEATLVTDEAGAFRFASPRNATIYRIVTTARGFAGTTAMADPRAPRHEQDPERIAIVLERCGATVEGTVMDSVGGPIVGASVSAGTGENPFDAATQTGADGHYALCVESEASRLHVGADGYEHVIRAIDARGIQRVDVELAPGASVSGRIVDDETGEPVANAQVFVASRLASLRQALSAADGTFEIEGIAADLVWLNVWSADHVLPRAISFEAIASRRSTPIEVRMAAGTSVGGTVRANGRPVPGASIRFDSPTPLGPMTSMRAVAGPDGRFLAINVARIEGVTVRVDGAEVASPSVIDTRALIGDLAIDVREGPVLRGHVMRHGAPVAGATVTVAVPRSSRATATNHTRTDASGGFELPAPAQPTFEVTAQSAATGSATARPTRVVTGTDVDLELDAAAVIEGRVVGEDGAPLTGVVVAAGDARLAISAVDGAFRIAQLAGGEYVLRVAASIESASLAWAGAPPSCAPVMRGSRGCSSRSSRRGRRSAVAWSTRRAVRFPMRSCGAAA